MKLDTVLKVAPWIATIGGVIFFIAMILAPWINYDYEWKVVQEVWDRWQTLNAGVLAFIASVIALRISKSNENKQRQRRFVAAKAFLPHALSELMIYFKGSAAFLLEAWERVDEKHLLPLEPLALTTPEAPQDYKGIFKDCISEADDDVAALMASLLTKLQIFNARITEVESSFKPDRKLIVISENIRVYLYNLAELQALINNLFGFARSMEDFSDAKLTWDDFKNAYSNLDIWIDEIDGLEDFTKRAISRS